MSENQVAHRPKNVSMALESPAIQKRVNELLGKRAPQFCSTLVAISRSSAMLAKCDPASVIGAAITAATLDLPINPNLGFAYVVPYGKEAQFQIGWKGIVQLALRTGQYEKMVPFKVNKDAFISFNPLTETLEVDNSKLNQEAEDIVGYGFYFKLVNGFEKTVYWSRERCEAHGLKYSQTFKRGFGVWKDNFDAMALKTVIKISLSQFGILSVEMQDAIEKDQAVSSGIDGEKLDYIDNHEEKAENPLENLSAADVEEVEETAEETKAEPAETKTEEKKEEPPAPEVDENGLTPVAKMDKSALIAECGVHLKAEYFAEVKALHVAPEFNIKQAPVSMVRDIVESLREAAAKA